MMTRIALVTGASRGIGAAVAKRLAREGLHTILAARGVEALTAIHDDIVKAGGNATILPIDLTDRNALEALAPALLERFDRLDALVGNAATLGMLGPIAHTSPDTFARTMNINLEANFHLIRLLEPLLMRSPAPRAVFVTSGVANRPMAYMNGYAVSKAALEMMVKIYAEETQKTKLRVNLIDPGMVRTTLRAKAFPGENPSHLPAPEDITDVFVKLTSKDCTVTGEVFSAY